MPFAVALLCHPAGAYGFLVATLAAFVYAYHTRAFVPAFTAASAGALTTLAFLQIQPDSYGLLLIVLGVVLLQCEFLLPTYGAALLTGFAASFCGSWLLLAPPGVTPALAPAARLAIALAGTVTLLATMLRGFRLRTLTAR
jgi:membrane-bound ClpP family serine protease